MNAKFFALTCLSTFFVYFFLLFTNPLASINADVILTIPYEAPSDDFDTGVRHPHPFDPREISASKGDIIKVINKDNTVHRVTSGHGPNDPNSGKIFETGSINRGKSSIIDTQNIDPGSYAFFCSNHPNMLGGTLTIVPKPEMPISIIIGAIVAIAAVGGAIVFLKFRKKSKDDTDIIDVK